MNLIAAPSGKQVYIIGIGGLALSGLALELHRLGWIVNGSDDLLYGAIHERLAKSGIPIQTSCSVENLPEHADLVLVGTTHLETNPELVEARNRGWKCQTFPEFLADWFHSDTHNLLVAGTNGKTSTTAMIRHILIAQSLDFSWLVGGVGDDELETMRLSGGPVTILEADESRCARWIPKAKCEVLPCDSLVLTSLAADHPESYASETDYFDVFRRMITRLPANGFLIAHNHDLERLGNPETKATVHRISDSSDGGGHELHIPSGGCSFLLDGIPYQIGLHGIHQARNAALAMIASRELLGHGYMPLDQWTTLLTDFHGIKGRMQSIPSKNLPVIIDEGYHPQAIRENLATMRHQFPDHEIRMIFRPRYLGDGTYQLYRDLPGALQGADAVYLFPEETMRDEAVPQDDQFQAINLAQETAVLGTPAIFCLNYELLKEKLIPKIHRGMLLYFALPASLHEVWQYFQIAVDEKLAKDL